jgi:hypothetical protein
LLVLLLAQELLVAEDADPVTVHVLDDILGGLVD